MPFNQVMPEQVIGLAPAPHRGLGCVEFVINYRDEKWRAIDGGGVIVIVTAV